MSTVQTPLTADAFLRGIPGFSTFRRSSSLVSHPTTQGVSLRGMAASGTSRTTVVLDGIPLNDPFGGWVNWARVPLEGVESIRVQENWGSMHMSFLGLGSSIEMKTIEQGTREATVAGGSQDTVRAHLREEEVLGPIRLTVGGKYLSTNGYHVVAREDRGPIDINANSDHRMIYGRATYTMSPSSTAYLLWNIFDENRGNGTPLTGNSSEAFSGATGVTLKDIGAGTLEASLFGSKGRFESTFSSQSPDRREEKPALNQYNVPTDQVGFQFDWSLQTGTENYLELGGDGLWREGDTQEEFRFIDDAYQARRRAGAEQRAFGVYLFDRYRASSQMTIDGMVRLNGWRTSDLFRQEEQITGERFRDERESRSTQLFFEPRFQVAYSLSDTVVSKSTFTRGARLPTINELVRPFRVRNDVTEANPGLSHESASAFSTEVSYKESGLTATVAAFAQDLRDIVTNATVARNECGFLPEDGICRRRQNVPSAFVGGGEVDLRYNLSPLIELSGSYLYTSAKVDDAGEWQALRDKNLPQIPRHQGALRAEYHGESLLTFLQARYVGGQFEDDLNTLRLSQFIALDASVTVPVTKDLKMFLTAENLTGKRYQVGKSGDGVTTIGMPLVIVGRVTLVF